jgi:hypothetical protein
MEPFATRQLDPEHDWSFFQDSAPISAADRDRIRRLDDASSQSAWDAVVGQRVPVTVVLRDGWLSELSRSGEPFEWHKSWNAGDDQWAASHLRPRLPWNDDPIVLFIWRPTWSVLTPFEVFLRHWRAFLFDDEGPLLVSTKHSEVAWFWPTGAGRLGRRPMVR